MLCGIFYLTPRVALRIPQVQEYLAAGVAGELSARLNVPVRVGKVAVAWANRLVLKEVSLDDRNGERLFEAARISVGFELWPLLRKQWIFTTASISGFSLHLKRETADAPLNVQFLLDALAARDTTRQPADNLYLHIHSVRLRHGNVGYHVTRAPEQSTFDAKHLQIRDLDGQMALEAIGKDSLCFRVRKLSFEERSGFRLDNLSMAVSADRQGIAVNHADIRLAGTQLKIPAAHIRFDNSDSLKRQTEASLELRMDSSHVTLRDFAAFVPAFRNFSERIEISAALSGSPDDLSVTNLTLKQNGVLSLHGRMEMKNLTNPDATYLFGRIDRLQLAADKSADIVSRWQNAPMDLPAPVLRLGQLDFSGEVAGFTDHLVAFGKLQSDIGSMEMDMLIGSKKEEHIAFYMKGRATSSELNLHALAGEDNPFGTVCLAVELDASRPAGGSLAGNIHAQVYHLDYNRYRYKNVLLAGAFNRKEFNGRIDMDDVNGRLHAEGFVRNDGAQSVYRVSARLADLKLDELHFAGKYDQPQLSLSLSTNFTGNHPDNMAGEVSVNDLSFRTASDYFHLDSLQIEAMNEAGSRRLTIRSDMLNGEINGVCSFASLWPSLLHTAQTYLPSLTLKKGAPTANAFDFALTLENTEPLANAFKLPFANIGQGHISGRYDNLHHTFRLDVQLPGFRMGKTVFEHGSVAIDNPDGQIRLQANTAFTNRKGIRNVLRLESGASNDQIRTLLTYENNQDKGVKIEFAASTLFVADRNEKGTQSLRTEITLEPRPMLVHDSVWYMEPASVTIMDGNTTVDNFYISKNEQYLRINGTTSTRNPGEAIQIELNGIELSHIFDIVNIPALQFGGQATGLVSAAGLYGGMPVMNADLDVRNFSFNQVVQGNLKLSGEWNDEQEGILMLGTIYRNDSTWTDVNGYIFPVGDKEGLSLYFDANDLDMALLHPYVDGFTKIVEGRASGKIHLFGSFKDLTFEGKAFVADGRIGVDFLHTDYTFADTVYVTPASFYGKDITVRDRQGNRGVISFDVQHNYLTDFIFQMNIQAQNLLIYDAPESVSPHIYGLIYGTGNAQISGNEQSVNIEAGIRTDAKTSLGFNFMNGSSAGEYDFITFRAPPDSTALHPAANDRPFPEENTKVEVRADCQMEVTPEAALELVIDPVSGDKLKSTGSGNVQIHYGSHTNLSLYGGYTLRDGNYNFSLQQLVHKDFKIREGSRIDFRGDPMDASLNLSAAYFLTANMEDLDQSLAKESLTTSVPVNCVLMLNGRLQNPAISFDMELPNSTGELARQVKSFIDTEDMMARQIVYLLALNKFYTPDYSRNDRRSNEFSAVASSALSAQLSNILNSLTDKVQIGANIRSRQDGVTDTEAEMLLSSQLLDNRLLFNGNFGYKNNFIQTNAFIGEFDLEYKLTPRGDIRLKAYNHANDMYRYNMKSLNRQGAGIMFRKDFFTLPEIFRRRERKDSAPPANATEK
ncbi:MAG: translocation/assembly module TamB domain-containing protein [Tannerella sp.]|jgi:hypothetical protein|nr:translocation/assembly module TamB domain-containing protein [Tannerella sp.]